MLKRVVPLYGLGSTAMFSEMDGDIETEKDEDHTNWREPAIFQRHGIARSYLNTSSGIPSTPTPKCMGWSDASGKGENKKINLENEGPIDHHRCIIHIDFDCFYCQVEAIRNPALKGRPFGVYQKHIVVSSNYEARRLGVKKMSTRAEALKACPEMIMVNGEDLTVYRDFSMKMFNTLKIYSPFVERIGFDENFIDVTKIIDNMVLQPDESHIIAGHCFGYEGKTEMNLDEIIKMENGNACQCGCFLRLAVTSILADKMRKQLHTELGLTSSAGIAHCKVLAKLIGKTHKPNQQTTILPTYAEEFLSCKAVREIPGIGSHCSKELNKLGIETVSRLQCVSNKELLEMFGTRQGNFLIEISQGIDNSVVNVSSDVPKSISEEESFRKLSDFDAVKIQMRILISKLLVRLEKDGRAPKTIKLSVRKHNMQNSFARVSRQKNFDPRILKSDNKEMVQNTILENVITLFDKMIDDRKSFNLAVINIGFTNFDDVNPRNISKFFLKENNRNQTHASASNVQHSPTGQETIDSSSPKRRQFAPPSGIIGTVKGKADETCNDIYMYEMDRSVKAFTAAEEWQQINAAESHLLNREGSTDSNSSNCNFRDANKVLSNQRNYLSEFNIVRCPRQEIAKTSDEQMIRLERGIDILPDQDMTMPSVSSHETPDAPTVAGALETDSEGMENASLVEQQEGINCPTGVDSGVFRELPRDIQNELVQNWKRKEHEVVTVNNKVTPQKKKQKRACASAGSRSIISYFAK